MKREAVISAEPEANTAPPSCAQHGVQWTAAFSGIQRAVPTSYHPTAARQKVARQLAGAVLEDDVRHGEIALHEEASASPDRVQGGPSADDQVAEREASGFDVQHAESRPIRRQHRAVAGNCRAVEASPLRGAL